MNDRKKLSNLLYRIAASESFGYRAAIRIKVFKHLAHYVKNEEYIIKPEDIKIVDYLYNASYINEEDKIILKDILYLI